MAQGLPDFTELGEEKLLSRRGEYQHLPEAHRGSFCAQVPRSTRIGKAMPPMFREFFERGFPEARSAQALRAMRQAPQSLGFGFLSCPSDGYVLTNNHVNGRSADCIFLSAVRIGVSCRAELRLVPILVPTWPLVKRRGDDCPVP